MSKRRNKSLSAIPIRDQAILALVILVVLILVLIQAVPEQKRYLHHEQLATVETTLDNNLETYESNLPLVVLEIEQETLPTLTLYNKEAQAFYLVATNPYVTAQVSIYDQKGEINSLSDVPALTSLADIRIRGNTSLRYRKKQYSIQFKDENQKSVKLDVMGMGASDEWVMNISQIDKALIRNYLGYNIAGMTNVSSPDTRLCEAVLKTPTGIQYLGMYLMVESVDRGEARIDIPKYDIRMNRPQYILQRDRYHPDKIQLETYASKNNLVETNLSIKYPGWYVSEETIRYIEADVNEFEEILFSTDPTVFYQYRSKIDVASFIDYFIINEFFGNYDAGLHSTFIYKNKNNKFAMGPVWDFDGAFDNYNAMQANPYEIVMQYRPWFKQLVEDPWFIKELSKRYLELRNSILSEEYLFNMIDEYVNITQVATTRDWERWNEVYTTKYLYNRFNVQGIEYDGNTYTHEAEIIRIKQWIHEHGTYLDESLEKLSEHSYDFSVSTMSFESLAVIFVFVFAMIVFIIRKEIG